MLIIGVIHISWDNVWLGDRQIYGKIIFYLELHSVFQKLQMGQAPTQIMPTGCATILRIIVEVDSIF